MATAFPLGNYFDIIDLQAAMFSFANVCLRLNAAFWWRHVAVFG